jgi:flavin reductase (DIM6/NTAB) family NADH-FMN oxidoreductase RutF
MSDRIALRFEDVVAEALARLSGDGVLCTVADAAGLTNVLTLGWGLLGPSYHDNPICAIAITPLRYSWRFIESTPEFVLGIPDDRLSAALALCGERSGRDLDKFAAAGLTPAPSVHVRAPSIRECPVNIECHVFARVAPPHMLLTPEHRRRPLAEQHTIYFGEVLGVYGWAT